jgi:hypothetical protein
MMALCAANTINGLINDQCHPILSCFHDYDHCTSFDAKNSVFVDARLTLRLEKHKSRSTEFDARIFPVIQGHFVMPGGHYFSNVIILIPMLKPISVHFNVIAKRKEYS